MWLVIVGISNEYMQLSTSKLAVTLHYRGGR